MFGNIFPFTNKLFWGYPAFLTHRYMQECVLALLIAPHMKRWRAYHSGLHFFMVGGVQASRSCFQNVSLQSRKRSRGMSREFQSNRWFKPAMRNDCRHFSLLEFLKAPWWPGMSQAASTARSDTTGQAIKRVWLKRNHQGTTGGWDNLFFSQRFSGFPLLSCWAIANSWDALKICVDFQPLKC